MRLRTNLVFTLIGSLPLAVSASEVLSFEQGNELMREKMCLGCHQVEKKRVGPAFVDIANRYGGDREAALPMLVNSIKNGGRGKWGAVPMPAQTQVSDEQAYDMALFILSLQQKPE
ncbi:MAG: c-type cytochrome [Burkholderiaceae bacterium]|nr:c-type cytochrome [Burkholderiaceae bacterium]MCD8517294.1 c-type cytochrome [Burkholderiaceae bacterium]MCD8537594.1 c-type cytochrome [Burkholderiaceae bacterium]MCD8565992.1 c-type cytochrome [Burkholderiaceae bacterium]